MRVALTTDAAKKRAVSLIQRAPANWLVELREQRRSDDQNSLMWSLIEDIRKHEPDGRVHTREDWKIILMASLFKDGEGLRVLHDVDGRPFLDGYRTSTLTVSQMADFLTFIIAFGDRHGVRWTKLEEAA